MKKIFMSLAVVAFMMAAASCSCSNNKKAECADACGDKKECCESKCASCDKADECGEAAVPACDAEKCADCDKAEGCGHKAE